MASYDFVYDLLETMESQGFDYHLVLFDRDSDKKNDKIAIYTTFDGKEFDEIIKTIKDENKDKKVKRRKRKEESDYPNL